MQELDIRIPLSFIFRSLFVSIQALLFSNSETFGIRGDSKNLILKLLTEDTIGGVK